MTTRAATTSGRGATGTDRPRRRGGPQRFDFRRPNKFSRDHVRALQVVHETFARRFATVVSSATRTVAQVTLNGVTQRTYDEFVQLTPNPSFLAILSLPPLPGAGVLALPLPTAMSLVDRMLGGNGAGYYPARSLTDIENVLLHDLMNRVLTELAHAFESLVALEAKVVQQEANPGFAQIAAPSEMAAIVDFSLRLGAEEAAVSLCLPFSTLAPVLETVSSQTFFKDHARPGEAVGPRVRARLLDVPVEVSVRFDPVVLTSAEIVGLRVGDVVPLGHPVAHPLTLTAEGVAYLTAAPGKRGKRLACQIVDPEGEPQP